MRDAEPLEQIGPVTLAGEADVGGDGEVWEQPVVLRQVANPTSLGAEVNPSRAVQPRLASERDLPGTGPLESGDRSQQRCLAGSGRADDRDRLGAGAQRDAKVERPPGECNIDLEDGHERTINL